MMDSIDQFLDSPSGGSRDSIDSFLDAGGPAPKQGFMAQAGNAISSFGSGLAGYDDKKGFNANGIAQGLGENAGPIAAMTLAEPFVLGASALTGPYAGVTHSALTGLASGAGRLAQTGLQDLASATGISNVPIQSPSQALSGAYADARNTALTMGGLKILGGAGSILGSGLKTAASTISGMAEPYIDRAIQYGSDVLDKAGLPPEAVPMAARAVKDTLTRYGQEASAAYSAAKEKIVNTFGDSQKFNFADRAKQSLDGVLNELTDPANNYPNAKAALAKLTPLYDQASQLGNATAKEIYYFQKELSDVMSKEFGPNGSSKFGAMLMPLEKETQGFLSANVPEIAEMNANFSAKKTAYDALSGIEDANNLSQRINSAYKGKTDEMLAIEEAKRNVPGFAQQLEHFQNVVAGQPFSQTFGAQARTGLVGSAIGNIGLSGGLLLSGNPLAAMSPLAAVAGQAALSSPKLIGAAIKGIRLAGNVSEAIPATLKTIGRSALISPALSKTAEAYGQQSRDLSSDRTPGTGHNPEDIGLYKKGDAPEQGDATINGQSIGKYYKSVGWNR